MAQKNILLIDESAMVQEIVTSILTDEGYNVIVASNGLAGVKFPELEQVDVILVDSELEGLDGFMTTRVLKSDPKTYSIPVLLLVPEEKAGERESVSLKGANAYMLKPFDARQLKAKVNDLFQDKEIFE